MPIFGDFCPPGYWGQTRARGPVSSLTWQANLLGDIADSPLVARGSRDAIFLTTGLTWRFGFGGS